MAYKLNQTQSDGVTQEVLFLNNERRFLKIKKKSRILRSGGNGQLLESLGKIKIKS